MGRHLLNVLLGDTVDLVVFIDVSGVRKRLQYLMSCNITNFYSMKAARQLMSECCASTLCTLLLETADGW